MLPTTVDITEDLYVVEPSLTYKLDFVNNRVRTMVDEAEAVDQAIQKILNTDKYMYEIYDWQYGHELMSLIGKPYDFVASEVQRIVTEALLQDDRIVSVDSFEASRSGVDSMLMSFQVNTIYGSQSYTTEVAL